MPGLDYLHIKKWMTKNDQKYSDMYEHSIICKYPLKLRYETYTHYSQRN